MKKNSLLLGTALALASTASFADCTSVLSAIGGYTTLETALTQARNEPNDGFNLDMWATVVSDDGTVCAVAKTGSDLNSQWLGSRVISAQKANTANAFSLQNSLSLSTANLWAATQPGGSLFGLQFSNPVDTSVAYSGDSSTYGTSNDPMVGSKIGGVNVFGGGLALYDADKNMIGAIGVSGDSSCADHNIAWRVRRTLNMAYVPAGVASVGDNIIFDLDSNGKSAGGFGHPTCTNTTSNVLHNAVLVADHPIQ